jgi:hypothetical protein
MEIKMKITANNNTEMKILPFNTKIKANNNKTLKNK